jgi:uncharacterized membrane protein YfcA
MTQPITTFVLTAIVSLIALESVFYWHRKTRGSWRRWPAGRSLMYLLIIIGVGFGYGVANQLLGQYAARPYVGFGLYLMFIAALIVIRLTIRSELRNGKKRLKNKHPTHTGPLNVPVASENEETPNE